ncbi:unnamed protein product [Leptosia nina]|uniref:Uncharacterized protein n=1 Tax=Leptosia nina TaxID=320188 RepID=A0AAV1JGS0_9NEOP
MDFTRDLIAFQGAILSADSAYPFSKIKARGGNEKKIEGVIKMLDEFLCHFLKEDECDKNTGLLRKFALYIVLNSDIELLEYMDGVGSVVSTTPTIPKCLMNDMLWQLRMEGFVQEIIVYSLPQLSLQVSDILIDHFKYFQPTKCLKNLQILVTSCYKLIYRLMFFNISNSDVAHAVNNFHCSLKYFYEPPNSRKLEMLKKDEKYKYVGNTLYALLITLFDCFKDYVGNHMFKPPYEIYEHTYYEDCVNNLKETDVKNTPSFDIRESIETCNTELLDMCKELVMEVSVEIYCAWSEFDDNGKSMQQTIGELCYKVQNSLKTIDTISEHPVINMLGQISCKPLDCVEVINDIDSDTILTKIQNEEKDKWVKALLHRNNLCNDLTLVHELMLNLQLLNDEECCKLFRICKLYVTETTDGQEKVLELIIKAFQRCSLENKIELLEEHFDGAFNDSLLTEQFSNTLVEVFNKLTMLPDADLSEVLCLFLQSPIQVYRKIFCLATENFQQLQIMVRIMKFMEKFSNFYYDHETESSILVVTKESMNTVDENKINNYVTFLCQLKTANILSGSKLLLLVIMPSLHNSLLTRNILGICIQCRLLIEAFSFAEVVEYRAPMLAMLGQVLDATRWKINTFEAISPTALELGLQLVSSLFDSQTDSGCSVLIKEKEKSWLKMKLRNIDPLNMYFYRQLWNPPGETFLEIVTGIRIHKDMDVERITSMLSKVLCSTTLQEWYEIWENLKIFPMKCAFNVFHEALLLIALAEKNHHSKETRACLMYCFQNFTQLARFKYLYDTLDENQILDVVEKIIVFENCVQETDAEHCLSTLLPLFAFMIQYRGYPAVASIWNSVADKL